MSKKPFQQARQSDGIAAMRDNAHRNLASVIVTSPPYNLGVKYATYKDSLPEAEYITLMRAASFAMTKALRPEGSLFLNLGAKPSDQTLPLRVLMQCFNEDYGWKVQNVFHWVKSIAIGDKTHGHFKPINSRRYVNDCHEYVFHLTRSDNVTLDRDAIGVPYTDKSNIKRWSGKKDRHCAGNVWYIPYKTVQSRAEKGNHPSTFPVELAQRCMKLHGLDKIGMALDPFCGTGATLLAARMLGLSAIGYDIDAGYVATANERLAAYEVLTTDSPRPKAA